MAYASLAIALNSGSEYRFFYSEVQNNCNMENAKKTAGKTAVLTPEQEAKLIENTQKLATINKIIDRVSDEDAAVRYVIFENGCGKKAVSSEPGREYFTKRGLPTETIHDPILFELLNEYFHKRKLDLLEEIYNIYQKGGEQ